MTGLMTGTWQDHLKTLAAESVDAVVTDPPYGLSFMGKAWDYQIPGVDCFAELFRVLKPGGRLLCFASSRTFHRMWCNVEDAGFTIEDSIFWLYGSGFPKHGSKLKPACEPICVARKGPVSLLNIDAARVEPTGESRARVGEASQDARYADAGTTGFAAKPGVRGGDPAGRWPANVAHDGSDEVMAAFAAFGESKSTTHRRGSVQRFDPASEATKRPKGGNGERGIEDAGTAARFFYCAKASKAERDAGLADLPLVDCGMMEDDAYPIKTGSGNLRDTKRKNAHPTVKPLALMRWLVRLVAKPGELVLDPFAGSGTTLMAAKLEGMQYAGCEQDAGHAAVARLRIEAA